MPFNYKLWVLTNLTRIPQRIETHQGKSSSDTGEPLETPDVENASETSNSSQNHNIFFDKIFFQAMSW